MFNTVYVLEHDPVERKWLESALSGQAHALVFLNDGAALLERLPAQRGDCLLCGADADATAALELVRGLRHRGEPLPVVVIGPHSAFRAAVDVARLAGTDFLERPISVPRLRGALRRAVGTPDEAAQR
jgi:DNA-binding NtrC family response regulator